MTAKTFALLLMAINKQISENDQAFYSAICTGDFMRTNNRSATDTLKLRNLKSDLFNN